MLFDPRRGIVISLLVVAASAVWFAAIWIDASAIFRRLGYAMHAGTLLAIFALLAGLAVAGLFLRFHRVRTELLEGRRVLARWRIDERAFKAFVPGALEADRRDKMQALVTVGLFTLAIFGGFALFDREAAFAMLSIAAAFLILMLVAFLLGQRVVASQLVYRGGEAIVGERGLLFNGVLHVWSAPLTWLTGARASADGRTLEVDYAFLSRMGAQTVAVVIPAPPEAKAEVETAAERLQGLAT